MRTEPGPAQGIFITGTSTDIGKTLISAILILAFKALYWKPVQTGAQTGMTDTEWIKRRTRLSGEHFLPEAYVFNQPCSPHLAAQNEDVEIQVPSIMKSFPYSRHKPVIVEGAGGVLVPLNQEQFMLDLMQEIGFPVLVVASSRLGTINHSLLTLKCLRDAGLEVKGMILNGPKNKDNKNDIERFGQTNVLAEIEQLPDVSLSTLERVSKKIPNFLTSQQTR
jgi:dethiobiotin synthase